MSVGVNVCQHCDIQDTCSGCVRAGSVVYGKGGQRNDEKRNIGFREIHGCLT